MLSHVSTGLTRCQLLQAAGWPGCVLSGGKTLSIVVAVMFQPVIGCRVEYGSVLLEIVVEFRGSVVGVLLVGDPEDGSVVEAVSGGVASGEVAPEEVLPCPGFRRCSQEVAPEEVGVIFDVLGSVGPLGSLSTCCDVDIALFTVRKKATRSAETWRVAHGEDEKSILPLNLDISVA